MPTLIQSDMVGTTPVAGSHLKIKAFEMELRVIEKHFQAKHNEYSPTTSHTPDTHTQQQCCCFSARFPQDGHKYILEVQPCPLSNVCGHLLWAAPRLSGSLRPAAGELSVTARCVDILSVITSEVPVLTCLVGSKSGQGPWSKSGGLSIMSLEDDMPLSSTSDAQGVLRLAGVSVIICSSATSVAQASVIQSSKISSDPDSLSE